jgi:DNA modification methylase
MQYRRIDADSAGPFGAVAHGLLIRGQANEALEVLPAQSVRTVVTSPPYWSLRDYATSDQIGCDDALGDYVKSIVTTFDQLHRVLTDDGTVWLNVGDSYTSGNRRYRAPDRKNRARAMTVRPPTPEGLKPKDLVGVPWRLAFALQDAGWWVRSEIIWNKPNAHPESVQDRPTKAHETVFLLSKNQDYYYNLDAVRGPNKRRIRTVWDIPTEPRRRADSGTDDHPAPMPASLAERCIALTSEPDDLVLDPYAGSGTTALAAIRLRRRWAAIDVSPAFVELIERRIIAICPTATT